MSRLKYMIRSIACDEVDPICMAEFELGAGTSWKALKVEAEKEGWQLSPERDRCPEHSTEAR